MTINNIYIENLYKHHYNKDNVFYEILGQNLKSLRKAHKYSQQDISVHLGVTYQQYQKYERGINRIPVKCILKLIDLFKIEPHEIFGESKNNKGPKITEGIHKKIDKNYEEFVKSNSKMQQNIEQNHKESLEKIDNLAKIFEKTISTKEAIIASKDAQIEELKKQLSKK